MIVYYTDTGTVHMKGVQYGRFKRFTGWLYGMCVG